MKAIGLTTYGGPDVLRVFDLPEPQPGAGEVRIRVYAASVNPTDALLRAGVLAQRLAEQKPPYIPGMDAAGIIEALGPENDQRLSVGDRVVALVLPMAKHKGAYAEQIIVPAASVVAAPKGADFFAASTLLMNALTVRIALDTLALARGETLAITGAAGAVGGYAIQLAKADGLRVIADAKPADRELVQTLGADVVVDRGPDYAARIRAVEPRGVVGLIDAAALQDEALLPAIADEGRMATVRGWTMQAPRGITIHPVFVSTCATDTARLDRLREQAETGVLTLRVATVFPAERAADAHRLLEAGGVRGRPILDFT